MTYKRGECSRIDIRWDETGRICTVGARNGSFPGMIASRDITVETADGSKATGRYEGNEISIQL